MIKKTLEKQERRGMILVAIVALINILTPTLQMILDFKLTTLLLFIAAALLSAGLFSGITWIRILFALTAGVSVLRNLFFLLGGVIEFSNDSVWLIILLIIQIVYSVFACLTLLFSKPVKDFLYRRKNG